MAPLEKTEVIGLAMMVCAGIRPVPYVGYVPARPAGVLITCS
jgi:hypothetical protein